MYYYCPKRQQKKLIIPWGVIIPAIYTLAYLLYLLQKQVPAPQVKIEMPQIQPVYAKEVKEESVEEHIKRVWGNEANIMIAIAYAESGFNCKAINDKLNKDGSWDAGLLQVNSIHGYEKTELLDCHRNTDISYKIYQSQGFRAWSVYNNGKYRKFL